MSSQLTFKAIASATSLPASVSGPTRSAARVGQMIDPSGPALVPVSLSAPPANAQDSPTGGTSGPSSSASSVSVALQQSLENRLRANLGESGSPEYALTWSRWDMPSGPPICRLRASVRPTSDNDCSGSLLDGWPSPKAQEDGRTLEQYETARQRGYEARKGKTRGGPASKKGGLAIAAQLAGWATPAANPTNTSAEAFLRQKGRKPNGAVTDLGAQARLASGTPTTSSTAATNEFGVLNPEHSRWLMGFPVAWGCCGATAIQSSPRSRRRSSGPSSKQKQGDFCND